MLSVKEAEGRPRRGASSQGIQSCQSAAGGRLNVLHSKSLLRKHLPFFPQTKGA